MLKPKKPRGKTATHHKILKRFFGGLPVVDSKQELRVFANDSDVDEATPKDPQHCVFANACRRQFGSHKVAFFKHIAYVELPDNKGNKRIERFTLPNVTTRSIIEFDKTGKANPGGYFLRSPVGTKTLEASLAVNRARIREPASPTKRKLKKQEDVRSGKGLVKFLGGVKEQWARD